MHTLMNHTNPLLKKKLAFIILTAASLASIESLEAEIYKQKQADGSVVFTDQPQSDRAREKVELQPTAIIPSVDTNGVQYTTPQKENNVEYSVLIQSPSAGGTYRDAQANAIKLNVKVTPSLKPPNILKITVDGQTVDSNAASLPMLYRGEHTVTATIVSKSGKTLSTASSTFFVHRFSGGG